MRTLVSHTAMSSSTRLAALILVLGAAFAHAQAPRGEPPPTQLALLPSTTGELTVETPFSLRVSGAPVARAEFSLKPEVGTLRIVCKWDSSNTIEVSVTAPAGHGLPGRIALGSQSGQSPITLELQLASGQVAHGPIYIEVMDLAFLGGGKGSVHGTMTATLAKAGAESPANNQGLVGDSLEQGKLLSPSEVSLMEAKLKSDPHDWSTRLALLSYYTSSAGLRMRKLDIIAARRRHILWAIENRANATDIFDMPELHIGKTGPLADPDGLIEAEKTWRRAIAEHSGEKQILINAALFSAASDPGFSEQSLQQAKASGHDDAYWDQMLGWLYATAMVAGTDAAFAKHAQGALAASTSPSLLAAAAPVLAQPETKFSTAPQPRVWFSRPRYVEAAEEAAARAVGIAPQNPYCLLSLLQVLLVESATTTTADEKKVAQKKVYGLFQHFDDIAVDPDDRILLLPFLASLAFDVEDDSAAKRYAGQALDLAPQEAGRTADGLAVAPLAIHDANDVLGRLALRGGDVALAKEYLLRAATITGGEVFSPPGPRMLLAQMLIDRGEREAVCDYLGKVKGAWPGGAARIDRWTAEIRQGKSVRLNLVDTLLVAPRPR